MRPARRGLTVIELVIIIAIVAIVATLVYRSMGRRGEQAAAPAADTLAPTGSAVATRLSLDAPVTAAALPGARVPVAVRATDDADTPIAGAAVEFVTQAGGGQATPALAITDANGLARTSWTLGSATADTLVARIAGGPSLVIPAAPAPAAP
ncbi:MAG TPA: prepilin-type N-terminal cleavage/methylation domain-containing protein [Gemmatimonadaceae bacterium]|nr:prepilin-type N-terminal cleavage/methylation domain-containing protein [Gemmatimonadaceae bacterium]